MENSIIELKKITKIYNQNVLLKDIDLSIRKGQSISFIGHNGIGKSTLLKIVSGLVRPDAGKIICSKKLLFHYIPEHFPKMNISAFQYIRHMGRIDGIGREDLEKRSSELFKMFYMDEMTDIPMKHLSKGTLQKVGVIQALLTEPDVLLLDEPLSGQDTDSQKVFIDTMNMLRKNGCTLLMSCHEMNLVNSISDTVYEIRDKQLQKTDMSNNYIRENDVLLFQPPTGNGSHIMDIPAGFTAEEKGPFVEVTVPDGESRELILLLLHKGWELKQLYHEGKIM
ncbi:ATP-binding cassette domain-containing protein [Murimonas intestini]|uniref:ATP-binding cassette domain-containing protein n=1 Tax=Murimonas intestini TaxID=1337051 RepID=UPI0011DDF36F|nr:ABC transporter ATP-binding protein [Murimonas intestini]